LIEILWNGVGAIQLHNSLTGIPMETTNKKGFSGIMLDIVYLIVLVVATFTKLMVICQRKKMKDFHVDWENNKVTKSYNMYISILLYFFHQINFSII
jgi:uncharacterized membrane protein